MRTKMIVKQSLFTLILMLVFSINSNWAQEPCLMNDVCDEAFNFSQLNTDKNSIHYYGCSEFASPDALVEDCLMGDYPTVWYRFVTDDLAEALTVVIRSEDFDMPSVSVFKAPEGDCGILEQVLLTSSNLSCVIGSGGVVKVVGTPIESYTTYYLAVSSYLSVGGDFSIYIAATSGGFTCVEKKSIEIVERENDGPLEGPFDPIEKVSICLKVDAYTGVAGCQWFQGVVPVFGNGWDPAFFDSLGQPMNATINGLPIGEPGNGVYGAAQWSWFDDVDYHHFSNDLTIGDLDNNGRLDMCNSRYDPDCPVEGIQGGCCNPCWGAPLGDILPPGWFAYGINGSCSQPGPPVRVDWGDGNSCGGPMGPWEFCFDLVTRDIPDCAQDSTTRDLSIGFFTFADGETGAWDGSGSVCAKDSPLKLSLEAKCGRITTLDPEILPPLENGDTLFYEIEEQDIQSWEWNISPFWAVPYFQNTGDNGFDIAAPLHNETGDTVDITGIFIGHYGPNFTGANDKLVKKIKFKLISGEVTSVTPDPNADHLANKIKIYPMPVTNTSVLEWSFELNSIAFITIYDAQGQQISQTTVFPESEQRKQFSTSDLTSGIYYVSFSNADFRHVTKMVKL